MESIVRDKGEDHIILTVNILWQIWKSRNAICFNDKRKDPFMVVTKKLHNGQNIRKYRKGRKEKGGGLRRLDFAVCTVKGFGGEGENDAAVRVFSSSNVDFFLFFICLRCRLNFYASKF